MRVLHVVPTYLPATRYGGPIYSVHALAKALAVRGHDVHVFTTDVDGQGRSPVKLMTPVELDGVQVSYFPTSIGRRLYRSPEMAKALADRVAGFDVIHIHAVFLWPTLVAASAARRAGRPYVLSPRGMLVSDLIRRKSRPIKSAWIKLIERRNLAGAAAIHLTSAIEADELARLKLDLAPTAVIANGLDLPAHSVAHRGRSPDAPPTLIFLGRVNWKKGLDRLVPALALVPRARMIVAGNDEDGYSNEIERLAEAHGVADRIQFVGPVYGEDKWRLMAEADAFVLPSYSENFGNAVLEAMAVGLPVVVTPEVGLAETVARTGAGLVADGNSEALAAAIRRLLDDPAQAAQMGKRGRQTVAAEFGWDRIAAQMTSLYEEIALGAGKRLER